MPLTHWLRPRPATSSPKPPRRRLSLERMEDRVVPATLPLLHSNPGAPAAVYLDFDGHVETSGLGSGFTTPPYDLDGDTSTFTDAEAEAVRAIWARAAEDFAPFNIDVTTVEPAVLAPGMPASASYGKAVRVAIGGDGMWYQNGAYGGVAAVGSFPSVAEHSVRSVERPEFVSGHRSWLGQ